MRGVPSEPSVASRSAPRSRRSSQASTWSSVAAQCRAVSSNSSLASRSWPPAWSAPEALQVPGARRGPEVAVRVHRRVLALRGRRGQLERLRRVAQHEALAHRPVHRREDGEARDDHGQENPPDPVRDQAARSPALPEHHREVAAQEEEERHAEAMDEGEERRHPHRAHLVGDHPGNERQGEARVEHDAQGHGEAPDGVQVMAPDRRGEPRWRARRRASEGRRPMEGSAWSRSGRLATSRLHPRTERAGVQGSNPTITRDASKRPSQAAPGAHLARSSRQGRYAVFGPVGPLSLNGR